MKGFVKIIGAVAIAAFSCIIIASCGDDKETKFSIEDFAVSAIKANSNYEPAPGSTKAPNIIFILRVTNQNTSTDPGISTQTVTSFTITSDSTLYSSMGDFAPNTDLTKYFEASDEINGTRIHNWDHQYGPLFSASKKQKHNFKFSISLDDGRTFVVKPGFYELIP